MSRWKFGIGALAWMGLIYWLSTGTGSTENTRPLVAVLVDWIQPGLADRLGPDWLGRLDWIVRKTAHMTEYAILTGLLLGALRGPGGVSTTTYGIAALIAVSYAAGDEWHQSMVPGRYATVGDVGWDAVGTALLCTFHRLRSIRAAAKVGGARSEKP